MLFGKFLQQGTHQQNMSNTAQKSHTTFSDSRIRPGSRTRIHRIEKQSKDVNHPNLIIKSSRRHEED